jgi:hypothetical protein
LSRRSRASHVYEARYIRFALGLAVVGLFYSRQAVVQFFSSVNPLFTLAAWYLAYGLFIYFVFQGVPFLGRRFGVLDALVIVMLTFAFLIVFNQVESPYAAIATGKNPQEVPEIFYATEDGVVFMAWQGIVQSWSYPMLCLPGTSLCLWNHWYDLARDLTYVATPLILVAISGLVLGASRAGRHVARAVR